MNLAAHRASVEASPTYLRVDSDRMTRWKKGLQGRCPVAGFAPSVLAARCTPRVVFVVCELWLILHCVTDPFVIEVTESFVQWHGAVAMGKYVDTICVRPASTSSEFLISRHASTAVQDLPLPISPEHIENVTCRKRRISISRWPPRRDPCLPQKWTLVGGRTWRSEQSFLQCAKKIHDFVNPGLAHFDALIWRTVEIVEGRRWAPAFLCTDRIVSAWLDGD